MAFLHVAAILVGMPILSFVVMTVILHAGGWPLLLARYAAPGELPAGSFIVCAPVTMRRNGSAPSSLPGAFRAAVTATGVTLRLLPFAWRRETIHLPWAAVRIVDDGVRVALDVPAAGVRLDLRGRAARDVRDAALARRPDARAQEGPYRT